MGEGLPPSIPFFRKFSVLPLSSYQILFIGNRRDSLEHLAVKRKAKLISPYIWRSVTANPKEPQILFIWD
jgi:hypothetical protein